MGFTLMELSIVLVIISLIVGGIIGGKALIRSAEIASVIREINSYKTYMNTFILQYDYMPGDLPNAREYWPGISEVDNGDGNGDLYSSSNQEMVDFWLHMQLAEIMPGRYTGEGDWCCGSAKWTPNINIPLSNIAANGGIV